MIATEEFTDPTRPNGFASNPQALQRGGFALRAVRGRQTRGLLERLAQAECNRFWQAEIAAKEREMAGGEQ
jgi:hypothetical protein